MSRKLWPTELRVHMVARVGLEPTTYRVWTDRSSQLSYLAINNGRDGRIRTCDTLIPNQVLYQAELHPEDKKLARPVGLEPATFWSVVKRSIQLSYGRTLSKLVGMEGFEPSQYCYQGILSPSRLPFRHIPKKNWRFLPDSNWRSQSCSLLPYQLG